MRFSEFSVIFQNGFFKPFIINDEGNLIKRNSPGNFDALTYDKAWDEDPNAIDNFLIDVETYIKLYKTMTIEKCDNLIPIAIEKSLKKHLHIKPPSKGVGTGEGQSWYTITPFQRLPFNKSEVMRMRNWCEKFFNNETIFKSAHYCVECGKHKQYPNLHIHALVHFKPEGERGAKGDNFARHLHTEWKKTYKDDKYNIAYKGWNSKKNKPNVGVLRLPCNTEIMINDKREYMNNGSKGSHENFLDLKIQSKFSF